MGQSEDWIFARHAESEFGVPNLELRLISVREIPTEKSINGLADKGAGFA